MFTTPIAFASMVFICTTVGAGAGMVLSRFLPEQQLSPETKDIVRLAMGLVLTMTALVLGLVTASAKSTFDAQNMAVRQGSANVLTLDRMLAQCGPDANDIRKRIKQVVAYRLAVTWPQSSWQAVRVATTEDLAVVEDIQRRIVALVPKTEDEKWYKGRALEISNEIFHARWLTFGSTGASVSWAFLAVLTFWLTAIFLSFGLFAPRNVVVGGVILISALSVAGAVFLIMEMDDPFTGLLKVSGEPLAYSLSMLGR